MQEIWKDIINYESLYRISSLGNIVAKEKFVNKLPRPQNRLEKPLKMELTKRGYYRVTLSNNNKTKRFLVHRLVAQHFIPNPDCKPEVNHINGIKNDNKVINLDWNTKSENQIHAYVTGLNLPKKSFEDSQSYTIIQKDLNGNTVKVWGSLGEANRSGISRTCISRSIRNNKPFNNHLFYKI